MFICDRERICYYANYLIANNLRQGHIINGYLLPPERLRARLFAPLSNVNRRFVTAWRLPCIFVEEMLCPLSKSVIAPYIAPRLSDMKIMLHECSTVLSKDKVNNKFLRNKDIMNNNLF